MNAALQIEKIIAFAIENNLIETEDAAFTRNRLLEIMNMDAPSYIRGTVPLIYPNDQ